MAATRCAHNKLQLERMSFRFQTFYHPESTYLEKAQQPSSPASTLPIGYFPYP
jgi:hypothetical protein